MHMEKYFNDDQASGHDPSGATPCPMTEKQLLRKAIAVAMFKKLHPNWDWAWHFDEYEKQWPGSSRRASYTSVGECVALADIAMRLCRADEK